MKETMKKNAKKTAVRKTKKKAVPAGRRMNCWEFMKCGREIGGARAEDLGVCAAAVCPHADGINRGVNGGRICWAIVGTYSCYVGKSSLTGKKVLCYDCEFHKKVLAEEGLIDLDSSGKRRSRPE
ncbi:MAG TPA: hypothetical protein VF790_11135 [Dissulfurispiraceae bacterium]